MAMTEHLCGRLDGGGYVTEHGTTPAYIEAGLCKNACLGPAVTKVPQRGGDIYLCAAHLKEYEEKGKPIYGLSATVRDGKIVFVQLYDLR